MTPAGGPVLRDAPMRGGTRSLAIVAGVWLATAVPVRGQTLVTIGGGGSSRTDCLLVLEAPANDPPSKPKKVTCFDGDPSCDHDGIVNGVCEFQVAACANSTFDPDRCTASGVASVTVDHAVDNAARPEVRHRVPGTAIAHRQQIRAAQRRAGPLHRAHAHPRRAPGPLSQRWGQHLQAGEEGDQDRHAVDVPAGQAVQGHRQAPAHLHPGTASPAACPDRAVDRALRPAGDLPQRHLRTHPAPDLQPELRGERVPRLEQSRPADRFSRPAPPTRRSSTSSRRTPRRRPSAGCASTPRTPAPTPASCTTRSRATSPTRRRSGNACRAGAQSSTSS